MEPRSTELVSSDVPTDPPDTAETLGIHGRLSGLVHPCSLQSDAQSGAGSGADRMARVAKRLSARAVATVGPGRHADGDGLYLSVTSDASGERRRWLLFFTMNGKRREMGLGSAREVSLAQARELAAAARQKVREGIDPIAARDAEPVTVPTFGDMADAFIKTMEPQFRNEKHRYQWRQTLGDDYCAAIRTKPVDLITTEDVLSVLKPIWSTKPETASRLRGRIERVLNAAKAKGYRSGENPAAWRGHLANLLPKRHKLTRGHHAAMPYADVPGFLALLRARHGVAALALEFTILTAARSGEVRHATWREFDLEAGIWTVPAVRMKAGRIHRVPLVPRALLILQEMAKLGADPNGLIFPGAKPGRPMSDMTMGAVLRRMKVDVATHGFRSSFRDWCGEETSFPREIAEAALAHVVGDETERAYRRGDALEKRRKLMDAWASFCEAERPTNVVKLGKPR